MGTDGAAADIADTESSDVSVSLVTTGAEDGIDEPNPSNVDSRGTIAAGIAGTVSTDADSIVTEEGLDGIAETGSSDAADSLVTKGTEDEIDDLGSRIFKLQTITKV